jgi:hypothetical protein
MAALARLLLASALAWYDPKRRLLFTHIPKNAGTSIENGVRDWLKNETPGSCGRFHYETTAPPPIESRWRGVWAYMDGATGQKVYGGRDESGKITNMSSDACVHYLMPICDLTLLGMGCMSAGTDHKSEEYVRASLRLCSHDGQAPLLAPSDDGVAVPVVSYAVIRDPIERLTSAWSHWLNDHLAQFELKSTDNLTKALPDGPLIDDFNAFIQSRDFLEMGKVSTPRDHYAGEVNHSGTLCSSDGPLFHFKGVPYEKAYGGSDDENHHYYYRGTRFSHPFMVPASALITECTVLLPMVHDISANGTAAMTFLESWYPGYVMGYEDHREDHETRHVPNVIENATREIIEEIYAEDLELWARVQNGTAYYPPNWHNCVAKLPDGTRAAPPPAARATARGKRSTSLQALVE